MGDIAQNIASLLPILTEHGVVDRFVRKAMDCIPARSRPVQAAPQIGIAPVQLGVQRLCKEMIIPIPVTVVVE